MTAGGPTLGHVLTGAAAHRLNDRDCQQAAQTLRLPQVRTWCVVLVDGLGWHNLAGRAGEAPFLTGVLANQASDTAPPPVIDAAIPTTTSTNLTFFGTGQKAGQTRMLGYAVRGSTAGKLVNLISWKGNEDPERWQRCPTVFQRLEDRGGLAASVGPWRFENSPLTRAALRGSEFHPAETLPARTANALGLLREPDIDLVYVYWGELDAIAHRHGWESGAWSQALSHLDSELESLARRMPMGTGMLITADHGIVDIPHTPLANAAGRLDAATHPQLSRDVDLIGGEPRFLHVYTTQATHVAKRWQDVLGDVARVRNREQAVSSGLFGPVHTGVESTIGDVVVAMYGSAAILDSAQQSAASMNLTGMHGSVTPAERQVPLAVVCD